MRIFHLGLGEAPAFDTEDGSGKSYYFGGSGSPSASGPGYAFAAINVPVFTGYQSADAQLLPDEGGVLTPSVLPDTSFKSRDGNPIDQALPAATQAAAQALTQAPVQMVTPAQIHAIAQRAVVFAKTNQKPLLIGGGILALLYVVSGRESGGNRKRGSL